MASNVNGTSHPGKTHSTSPANAQDLVEGLKQELSLRPDVGHVTIQPSSLIHLLNHCLSNSKGKIPRGGNLPNKAGFGSRPKTDGIVSCAARSPAQTSDSSMSGSPIRYFYTPDETERSGCVTSLPTTAAEVRGAYAMCAGNNSTGQTSSPAGAFSRMTDLKANPQTTSAGAGRGKASAGAGRGNAPLALGAATSAGNVAAKVAKKRKSRALNKLPAKEFTTTPENFLTLVQRLTGSTPIPSDSSLQSDEVAVTNTQLGSTVRPNGQSINIRMAINDETLAAAPLQQPTQVAPLVNSVRFPSSPVSVPQTSCGASSPSYDSYSSGGRSSGLMISFMGFGTDFNPFSIEDLGGADNCDITQWPFSPDLDILPPLCPERQEHDDSPHSSLFLPFRDL